MKCFWTMIVAMLSSMHLYGQTDRVSSAPKGYFSISADASAGYYAGHDYKYEDDVLQYFGYYKINDLNPIATSMRLALSRHTKRGKLTWGLSYYRSSSSLKLDTTYAVPGEPTLELIRFDQFEQSDVNNYFNIFFEPRLLQRNKFSLHAHASVGFAYLELETIDVPAYGGTIDIYARRAGNYGFMEAQNALGFTGRYRLNPYYSIYSSFRYNWLISTQTTELIELAAGIELNLRRGGVPTDSYPGRPRNKK